MVCEVWGFREGGASAVFDGGGGSGLSARAVCWLFYKAHRPRLFRAVGMAVRTLF